MKSTSLEAELSRAATACRARALIPPPLAPRASRRVGLVMVSFPLPLMVKGATPNASENLSLWVKPTQESKCCGCFQNPGVQPSPPSLGTSTVDGSQSSTVVQLASPVAQASLVK